MLHFPTDVSKIRNNSKIRDTRWIVGDTAHTSDPHTDTDPQPADAWRIRPLDARSLALSVLLGSDPPLLPTRALVALAELFEIPSGTMRTALSRLVAGGEVQSVPGGYHLAGAQLERKRSQDAARRPPLPAWNGEWHVVLANPTARSQPDRRRFRTAMVNHRFGERRPDTWARPSNLAAPPADPDQEWICVTGPIVGCAPEQLVAELWDLPALRATASSIADDLEAATALDRADPSTIPPLFRSAAGAVRLLRSEPALPRQLTPPDWAVDTVRRRYEQAQIELEERLRAFFRSATRS